MKNIQVYFVLLLSAIMIVLSSDQSRADNTYKYFYLYRNSDAYKSHHLEDQEENEPSKSEEDTNSDFRLYEDERDYYLKGDQGYEDEEVYEEEPADSISNDNDID